MQITNLVCPVSKYSIKCPDITAKEGITVHNTYNDASAMAEASYMLGRPEKVSFHVAVDDYRAVNCLPFDRSCYAAGDGRYGFGNAKTINIEICYSKSGGERFNKAEELAAEYIAMILKERGWGIDRVGTHRDRSGKYCPHRTLDMGWQRFLNKIEYYLNKQNRNRIAHLEVNLDKAPLRSAMEHKDSNIIAYLQKGTPVDLLAILPDYWGVIAQGYINLRDFDWKPMEHVKTKIEKAPLRKAPGHEVEIITYLAPGTELDIIEYATDCNFGRAIQGWVNLDDCN